MIRKLRIKLVIASLLSLLLVLAVILAVAGVLDYQKIVTDADDILTILRENDGSFPMEERGKNSSFPEKPPKEVPHFSQELPYESRYFSVFLTEDGEVLSVNTGKIAAVDTSTAISYARWVQDTGNTRGFADDYRYTVYGVEDETHMIFLDYGREMSSFRTFLFTSAAVSVMGLLAVMLLLILLSGHIVKPFSENYEKQKKFITDAGHELKTPLTIIDADAEVLEMDMGENEWLSDIRAQTKRLARLTNSLIQLARMEEQPVLEKIRFPVSDLVEETVETFQALAKTQNKTLSSQIQPMLSMTGDENAIRQLVTILMDNAVKYSDEGGQIMVTLEKQKNQIQLSVENTAAFVSPDQLEHLFDRFYRTDQSRNSRTGGYGLGLSIAAAIVAAHRGKIRAASRDGKSLRIAAVFPARQEKGF